ncbi:hypothetical protein EVAR_77196_1 [Eumeta japonica]|uniref:Uncharacterized protein n=1 Tax=Eumeta variegata TaxID=151549 RepID=A0A4C1T4X9_EUMVA|nr:hypothetical protein EVAR_77196_1 [Eumeta japonica]
MHMLMALNVKWNPRRARVKRDHVYVHATATKLRVEIATRRQHPVVISRPPPVLRQYLSLTPRLFASARPAEAPTHLPTKLLLTLNFTVGKQPDRKRVRPIS